MKKKPDPKQLSKIDYREHEALEIGEYPDISNVASATECTGLMYRTPKNEEEIWQRLFFFAVLLSQRPGQPGVRNV